MHCVTKVQYSILWGGGSKVNNERLQTPIWYYRISEELLAEFYLMSTDFSKCVFKTLGWVGSYFCNTESAVIREAENPVNFIENGQNDTYISLGHCYYYFENSSLGNCALLKVMAIACAINFYRLISQPVFPQCT